MTEIKSKSSALPPAPGLTGSPVGKTSSTGVGAGEPVTEPQLETEVSGGGTLGGKLGWSAPTLRRPYRSEDSSGQPAKMPVSIDLLWLLSRPFEQGRLVGVYKGQGILTLLDENNKPIENELPDGYFAIVPLSERHLDIAAGRVTFMRRVE